MSNSRNTTNKPGYLFVLSWSLDSIGGVNQVVENLIIQMERDNVYTPLLMVNSWNDRILRKEKVHNINHFYFRLRSIYDNKRPIKNFLGFLLYIFPELYRLHLFLKVHRVSVANVHYCGLYALNFSILKALGLFKGKLLLSFHGKHVLTILDNGLVPKQLWKLLFRTSDNVITCSEALKYDLTKVDERSTRKIVAIHNGIDTAFMEHERAINYHLDKNLEGKKFLLNVATFEHNKGQDILLKAFSQIESSFPDVDLVMIGRPEGALHSLKNLVQDLNLVQRVYFYEGVQHSQVAAFYENAMIFVLPSRYESFGIVLLEAGSFGIPVIASRVGGIGEIISHTSTGRLFESEDVSGLADEIKYLLMHPEERTRLGENLKKHVNSNFSWETAYKKYLEILGIRN